MAVGAQGRNVAWGAVTSQLWGRRLQLPLYGWWSSRMGGTTLYRSQSFEPSWLVVTGTEDGRENRKEPSKTCVSSVSPKMLLS